MPNMDANLVYRGDDSSTCKDVIEVVNAKVRDANGTEFARFVGFFQGLPDFDIFVVIAVGSGDPHFGPWTRSVNQHQIDMVAVQAFHRTLDAANRFGIRLDFGRNFRSNKDAIAMDSRCIEGFFQPEPYTGFIFVSDGRVYMTITGINSSRNRSFGHIIWRLPCS